MDLLLELFESTSVPFHDMHLLLKKCDTAQLLLELQSATSLTHKGKGLEKTRLFKNDLCEVMLLSWEPGYTTLPHDHAANGCWLRVLQGSLTEVRYDSDLVQQQVTALPAGTISFMSNEFGYHAIFNDSSTVTWSLHVYSPPGHHTTYFNFVL